MTDLLLREPLTGEEREEDGGDLPTVASRRSTPKVLMVGATPPPFHGSIMMFGTLLRSPLKERFRLLHLDISDHRDLENIGRIDFVNVRLGICHALACWRALKQERPDLVYVPLAMTPLGFFRDSLFLLMARARGLPCVIHAHGGHFDRFYQQAPAPMRPYIRWSLKGVAGAVVHSQALTSMFAGLVPENRIWPVSNGIEGIPEPLWRDRASRTNAIADWDEDRPAQQGSLSLSTNPKSKIQNPKSALRRPPTVLYLGNLIEAKGFLDVMMAAPLVAREVPGVRFVLAGAYFLPSDREKSERLLQDPAVRAVVDLPGVVSGDARFELMLDADVFVFPSYFEGQPTVLLEAMSAGLPIITTDEGAIRDTIADGETGYLVPKGDPAAIARRVIQLFRDDALRQSMGMAGRRRFQERFRVETYGHGMERVFEVVLQERTTSQRPA